MGGWIEKHISERNEKQRCPAAAFIVHRAFMYLIVLSPQLPGKKMKEETRCLCLKDKADAVCYGQTGEEGGESVPSFRHRQKSHTHTHTHKLNMQHIRMTYFLK